jgi:precorrin-2 dehydrogenase/sirohydrochlorin ferrochelatase
MAVYYPVMLDLSNTRCVVIGGGKIAERKIEGLLAAGASVVVISPEFTEPIERRIREGRVGAQRRRFEVDDLTGAFLVFAATDDDEVNREIAQAARERGILVNAVSSPEDSRFVNPAVFRRGELTVAVSTSGRSPAAAALIRDWLEAAMGDRWDSELQWLAAFRRRVREITADGPARERIWHALKQRGVQRLLEDVPPSQWTEADMDKLIASLLDGSAPSAGGADPRQ